MSEEKKSLFTAEQIADLNKKHRGLSPTERIKLLYEDFGTDEIMLTSSFAATSAFLLKLFTEVKQEQKVFFIDKFCLGSS